MEEKLEAKNMPEEAKLKTAKEIKKLKSMSPMSAEAAVVRNYIDWVVQVPWKKRSRIRNDLAAAELILDEDHFEDFV